MVAGDPGAIPAPDVAARDTTVLVPDAASSGVASSGVASSDGSERSLHQGGATPMPGPSEVAPVVPAGMIPGGGGDTATPLGTATLSTAEPLGTATPLMTIPLSTATLSIAEPRSRRRSPRWGLRVAIGLGVVVIGGVVVAGVFAWPRASIQPASDALAQIGGIGSGQLESATATYGGHSVRLVEGSGGLVPVASLPQGASVTVTAEIREPSWLAWATGATRRVTTTVVTPKAALLDPVVVARPGAAVEGRLRRPVRVFDVLGGAKGSVPAAVRAVTEVAIVPSVKAGQAGEVQVVSSPEPWEALSPPETVSYFGSSSSSTMLLTEPDLANRSVGLASTLRLVFSSPVSSIFGKQLPTITPVIQGALVPKGRWSEPTPYSVQFVPAGPAFWPGEQFRIALPEPVTLASTTGSGTTDTAATTTRALEFTGAAGSMTRLQQLLATLGYLPVSWAPTGASTQPTTMGGQAALVPSPPAGTFTWRWTTMPSVFTSLWQQGADNVITEGAIMAFERVSNLDTTGTANPLLWPTLISAVLDHKSDPHPYTWIEVSQNLPETLTLYQNGAVALTSLTNTGIPQAPTAPGTYPIYLRLPFQIMRGTNPDGSTYADPVHWINYFNGSDAVHGFVRASYGFPQSLGCSELPIATAATLYPMVHIGTLVTVLP
ncbi:MAG: L,D-transpeptidase [Acidimicrobiales bacterium]